MTVSLSELKSLRRRVFSDLEKRYPDDPELKFIKDLDKIIEQKQGGMPTKGGALRKIREPMAGWTEIHAAICQYQKATGNQYKTVTHWLSILRERGIALPANDQACIAKLVYYITRNKNIYEKDKSRRKRDPMAWRIVNFALG